MWGLHKSTFDTASVIKMRMSLSFQHLHAVLITKVLLNHVADGNDDKLKLRNYAKEASVLI